MKQAEKIDKIYYAIFGMNGTDGIMKRQDRTDSKLDALFRKWDDFVLTRAQTCPVTRTRTDRIKQYIGWALQIAGWATLITKLAGLW